jgi:hypothetical protein
LFGLKELDPMINIYKTPQMAVVGVVLSTENDRITLAPAIMLDLSTNLEYWGEAGFVRKSAVTATVEDLNEDAFNKHLDEVRSRPEPTAPSKPWA